MRVLLVILEHHVVLGLVPLDEVGFQDERFFFVVSDDDFKITDARDEFLRLCIHIARALKILAHTITQDFGFANIDDFAFGVFVQIAARLHGQVLYFLVKRHSELILGRYFNLL
jgi:hypothetical protein